MRYTHAHALAVSLRVRLFWRGVVEYPHETPDMWSRVRIFMLRTVPGMFRCHGEGVARGHKETLSQQSVVG